ncbi:hypothetical protein [Microbacterium sp. HSID17254]|uniref:hypothetical protein n=1 Tax=Microbacterium sp. HSID17254 TaxID=2419509 RepID=UPI001293ADD6|nr:hypothetical protein [Microbacterium sp. HSID17254]
MNIDRARETLSQRLLDLATAERSLSPARIRLAQEAVARAEKILVEVTLRDEGGWKP